VSLIGGALLALSFISKVFAEQILGISLTWEEFRELIGISIEQMTTRFAAFADRVGEFLNIALSNAIRRGTDLLDNFGTALRLALVKIAASLPGVGNLTASLEIQENLLTDRLQLQLHQQAEAEKAAQTDSELRLKESQARKEQILADSARRAGELVENIRRRARAREEGFEAPIPGGGTPNLGPKQGPAPFDPFQGTTTPRNPKQPVVDKGEKTIDALRNKQAQLIAEARIAQVRAQGLPSQIEEALIAEANVQRARDLLELLTRRGEIRDIENELDALRLKGLGDSEKAITLENRILEIKKAQAELAQQEAQARRAQASELEGMKAGFKDVGAAFGTAFQAGFDIAQTALTKFSAAASTIVKDAINPEKDVDFRQIFSDLFQDLSDIIIEKLTDQAIAALVNYIIKLAGSSGGGSELGGDNYTQLFSEAGVTGGRIRGGGMASPAHFRSGTRGYRAGGRIRGRSAPKRARPRGIDRRDTVPIWAQADEFMHPVEAVKKYGLPFMEAVRSRALDPALAQSMVASTGAAKSAASTTGSGGFATGGVIPRSVNSEVGGIQLTQQNAPAEAFVVADQQSARRMMERNVFRRMLRENKDVTR
jgi:hypothetical protein